MGNACCSGGEGPKPGAIQETNFTSGEDDNYDEGAKRREEELLRHAKMSRLANSGANMSFDGFQDDGAGLDSSKRIGHVAPMTRVKREKVMATPIIEAGLEVTAPSIPKSPETTQFLLEAMGKNFVFDSIDEETKLQFVAAMQHQQYGEGEWVMHQGDVGDYFYIVEEGEVSFHVDGEKELAVAKDNPNHVPKLVGRGGVKTTFGELALLYNTPRAASVRATIALKLYKIDQVTFRSLLMSSQVQDRSNLIAQVEKLDVFQNLDDAKVMKLADAFTVVDFREGERVFNKGDRGNILYIVKSGQVKVEDIGHGSSVFQDHVMGEGRCFGDRALITGETRAANVSAFGGPASLLAISKDMVEEIIGPLKQAMAQSVLKNRLGSIPLLANLTDEEIQRCVGRLQEETYKVGDKIPTSVGKFFWIEEGHVLMMTQQGDANKLVKFEKGDYFMDLWGKRSKEDVKEGKAAKGVAKVEEGVELKEDTINVEADMKCHTLLTSDIKRIAGNRMTLSDDQGPADRGSQNAGNPPRRSALRAMQSMSTRFDYIKEKKTAANRDVMNLSKLNKHHILGMGTFGKVWLVTAKSDTKVKLTTYALKMISKRQLLEQTLAAAVLREKNVMESIQHPFLVNMESSFQDENYLYIVMEPFSGGELFDLIYPDGKTEIKDNPAWKESLVYKAFGEEEEKPINGAAGLGVRKSLFYSACIIDAFAYLHDRRIVYRDLKPENIMLKANGYCVVIDMGFAKVVTDKTYTVCGTPEYLAPEIIANKGHNHVADYWSFGCMLYELIMGHTPFFKPNIDQLSLLKKIVKADYAYPPEIETLSLDNSVSSFDKALCHWKDLISRVLKPKSVERLGNLRHGVEDILDHDWFASIGFNEFRNESIPAPWVPPVKDSNKLTISGNVSTQDEEPEVFKYPLSAKDQQEFRGF